MADIPITDIAISGMSCRFPRARSVAAFRDMLVHGRAAFRPLSLDEVVASGVPSSIAAGPSYVRVAAPLEGIDEFDVDTFGLAPSEVAVMDPQHYHFLECTYEALHSACCLPGSKERRIGVFGGADLSYYAMRRISDETLWDPMGRWQDMMGNDSHFMATFISYRLGLTGPSVGIQTACSTSLVAVHMAVQALIAGDCDAAVAGGVSIRGPQARGYLYRDGSILSPTGRCRPFDKDADGTVLSSGVGAVVMMRLADAVAEDVPIWAVIKGSAINNDGNRKVGYTAPSVEGQTAVIAEALSVARADPATVGYIEAHGTGTQLGDAIEYRGLIAGYTVTRGRASVIRIGSVKSNVGHLESAAGVAGLIKAVLAVHYAEIYPSLGYASPNPEIDFTSSLFRVADRYEKAPALQSPRRAAVSSFGIGGTNCHVVIEQAPWTSARSSRKVPLEMHSYPFHRGKVWTPPVAPGPKPDQSPSPPRLPDTRDPRSVLAGLWRDVLGKAPEPADGFLSSGGDSLKATQLAVTVRDALGIEVSVEQLLDAESFAAFADMVAGQAPLSAVATYPLSVGQQSLWMWQSLNPLSPAYTVQAVFSLKGTVDINALRAAFSDLVARQEALRSAITAVNGQPCQRIVHNCASIPWRYVEAASGESSALTLVAEHGRMVIDLSRPPLLSVLLVRTGKEGHLLSVISHHIVSDEWAAQVMLGDALEFYAARTQRRPAALPDLGTSLGRAAQREQQWLKSGAAEPRLRYWRAKLADPPRCDLPWDRQRSDTSAYAGSVLPVQLSEETYAKVKRLAHTHKSTPFMVLATAFKVLWLRYTGQSDLCIGTNIAGREDPGTSNVVGLFTNTVALRTDLSRNPTFAEALQRVRRTACEAYEHQLPFPLIVDAVRPPRMPARNPLFDVMFVLQNVPRRSKAVPGLEVEAVRFHNGTCKFDMELTLEESADGALVGQWEYDTGLFDCHSLEQFSRHFTQLLESAVGAPDERLSRLGMVAAEERTVLLDQWNQTDVDFGIGTGRHSLWDKFLEQARRHGAAPAVIRHGRNITTYDDLARRAGALASHLRDGGVTPSDLVGIFCERSEWYIQALLAVQACGAAFLPLDPSLPDLRLADILRESHIHHVVTRKEERDRLERSVESLVGYALHKVVISDLGERGAGIDRPLVPVSDLAYVIYTSGSTGKPKGAMISQAGMLNHLYAKIRTLDMNGATRMAFTAPLCFDISIWQCLAPLLAGGTVVVISDDEISDIGVLLARLSDAQVNIVELVPSYLDVLLGHLRRGAKPLPDLRFMVATGERLPVESCRRWLEHFPGVPVVNAYGPTECSDDVLQYVVQQKPAPHATSIPIGYALPNTKVYVLDEEREPVPVGAVGEVYVGGICVGRGYLNDVERTAAAFLPDPFSGQHNARLYRTGDLARRWHNGAIEYLGRRDGQIKVHGARIEVEEVEALLRQCCGVGEVAVAPTEQGDSLVAIVTPPLGETEVDVRHLRSQARVLLPRFMLPSAFLPADEIPKTSSGKIDRVALSRMARPGRTSELASEGHAIHEATGALATLHDAWCRVLNRESVHADADFFEMGGDSLKAIRVASIAQRAGLAITPADLLAHPVLRDLVATCIERPVVEQYSAPIAASGARTGLTLGERWFLDQDIPDAHLCDSAFLLTFAPGVQTDAVDNAVMSLWQKHEGLRTMFAKDPDGGWRTTVLSAGVPPPFSIVDTSALAPELANHVLVAERNRISGKDGPLFRATLFTHGDHLRLLVVAHYLACDLVSWQILLDEFQEAFPYDVSLTHPTPERVQFPALDSDEVVSALSVEETHRLLAYSTRTGFAMEIIVTAAVAHAVSRIQGWHLVHIAIGRHGRYPLKGDTAMLRAVGRLAYPILVEIPVNDTDVLEQVLPLASDRLTSQTGDCQELSHSYCNDHAVIGVDYLGDVPLAVFRNGLSFQITSFRRRGARTTATPFLASVVAQVTDSRFSARVSADADRVDPLAVSDQLLRSIRQAIHQEGA